MGEVGIGVLGGGVSEGYDLSCRIWDVVNWNFEGGIRTL